MDCFSAIIKHKATMGTQFWCAAQQNQPTDTQSYTSKPEWYTTPPINGMELTGKSVTPFARGRAMGAPLLPAAHSRRYAAPSALLGRMTSMRGIAHLETGQEARECGHR
jgi:hypothetical protein